MIHKIPLPTFVGVDATGHHQPPGHVATPHGRREAQDRLALCHDPRQQPRPPQVSRGGGPSPSYACKLAERVFFYLLLLLTSSRRFRAEADEANVETEWRNLKRPQSGADGEQPCLPCLLTQRADNERLADPGKVQTSSPRLKTRVTCSKSPSRRNRCSSSSPPTKSRPPPSPVRHHLLLLLSPSEVTTDGCVWREL